jgi:hypothetical protein
MTQEAPPPPLTCDELTTLLAALTHEISVAGGRNLYEQLAEYRRLWERVTTLRDWMLRQQEAKR